MFRRRELPSARDVVYLSFPDEIANTLTHGLSAVLSVLAYFLFAWWSADKPQSLGLATSAYTIFMTLVYVFSTLSHAIGLPLWRHRMRALDQGMIYFLIAATYSPFLVMCSPTGWSGILLVTVWGLALVGFFSKVLWTHRIHAISTVTYVLIGWLPALPIARNTPGFSLLWMVAGGLCYTGGIYFLRQSRKRMFHHALWHLFVMAGSACHAVAIWYLTL